MASPEIVLIAALGAILFYSCVGLALASSLAPGWAPPLALAPVLGWGVFTALSFPVQDVLGFTRASTAMLAVLALGGSLAVLILRRRDGAALPWSLPLWACALAALIALVPLSAILPKPFDGGFILAGPMFDHSKVAMVDEMTRQGLPAGNPFFGDGGVRGSLSYYYLWHFGAAQMSILSGATGWDADAAMTGFTGYASLLLMMGVAARLSVPAANEAATERERRWRPALAVVAVGLFSLTGSLRPLLNLLLGAGRVGGLLSHYPGLAGWVVQSSWVPQHMMSACCVVAAVLMLGELAQAPRLAPALLAGALAAAGFGSSAYVGGIAFAVAAGAFGVTALILAKPGRRIGFMLGAALAAVLALGLALPFLLAEVKLLTAHLGGSQFSFHPYEVIGKVAPAGLRRVLDYPAYWLVLLPLELPAIYPAGAAALVVFGRRALRRTSDELQVVGLAVLVVCSLGITWLFASTVANNDLGWRAMLPAVLVLTACAGAGLARWIARRAYVAAAAAVLLFALSVPDRQIALNLKGKPSAEAQRFADSVQMWKAVRRYAGPTDRVADNPLFLMTMTIPVNPSWALLSDRPSCYSGWETARVYVDLPRRRIEALDQQFIDVFGGDGTPQDIRQMAEQYGCRVVVLAASDGAWDDDPFDESPDYRLVEERKDKWRIYVATVPTIKPTAPARGSR